MEERKIVAGAQQEIKDAAVSRRELRDQLRETSRSKPAGKAAGLAKSRKPGLY